MLFLKKVVYMIMFIQSILFLVQLHTVKNMKKYILIMNQTDILTCDLEFNIK